MQVTQVPFTAILGAALLAVFLSLKMFGKRKWDPKGLVSDVSIVL